LIKFGGKDDVPTKFATFKQMDKDLFIEAIIIYHAIRDNEVILFNVLLWNNKIIHSKADFFKLLVAFLLLGDGQQGIANVKPLYFKVAHLFKKFTNESLSTADI